MSWRYLMGVVETFEGFLGDISCVSWRYLVAVLDIFSGCPGNI